MENKLENKDLNYIIKIFDELNFDETHFTNSNDICTPMSCVKEMVDSIPMDFWKKKNLKILDSCSGNGNFHAYIQTKTSIKNLYFNDINNLRIENSLNLFGKNINITKEDFLMKDETEKFDLIVSNPPYAKFTDGKRASKNHNLSRDFIKKSLKLVKKNGYILFIVPDNWMSFADRNKLPIELTQLQFIHLNIHGAKKYFPKVGSSFTWFLIQNKKNENEFLVENSYKIKDVQKVKLSSKMNFIPLYCSKESLSLIDKVVNSNSLKFKIETSSNLHKHTKKDHLSTEKNSKYKYKIIHTPTQTIWSDTPHKYQEGYKVFISLTNQYSTFIDNCGMTQSIAFIRCESKSEAEKIKNELDNDIYKAIVNLTRYGNFNNVRVLQNLSRLDEISLSLGEKKFVEKFNKEYYGE
jgi:adenine-specific DNA-methyltransferase